MKKGYQPEQTEKTELNHSPGCLCFALIKSNWRRAKWRESGKNMEARK